MKEIWFKRKLYGYGWTLSTWQGWVLTFGYLGLFILMTVSDNKMTPWSDVVFNLNLPAILLTVTYILVVYIKGQDPRWQWGKQSEELPEKRD